MVREGRKENAGRNLRYDARRSEAVSVSVHINRLVGDGWLLQRSSILRPAQTLNP